jgi:hypothetical protein
MSGDDAETSDTGSSRTRGGKAASAGAGATRPAKKKAESKAVALATAPPVDGTSPRAGARRRVLSLAGAEAAANGIDVAELLDGVRAALSGHSTSSISSLGSSSGSCAGAGSLATLPAPSLPAATAPAVGQPPLVASTDVMAALAAMFGSHKAKRQARGRKAKGGDPSSSSSDSDTSSSAASSASDSEEDARSRGKVGRLFSTLMCGGERWKKSSQ